MNENEIQQLMAQMKAESPDLPNQEIYNFLHANNFGSDADRYKHLFGDIKLRTEGTSVAAANNTFGTLAKDFIQTIKDNPEYSIPAAFLGGYAANKALPQVGEAISSGMSSLKNRFLSNTNKSNIVSTAADAPTVPSTIAQAQTDTDLNTYIANSEKAKADKIRYAQEQEAIRSTRLNNQPVPVPVSDIQAQNQAAEFRARQLTPVVPPPAPPAAPVDLVAAAQSGQDMSQPIKEDVAHMLQEADKTPSEIKVKGLVRDAQGNFQYPPGMSPAAIEGHKAFNQQYPEHARALEAEGKFGIVGGGAADNNLKNSYGVDLRKRILNEVNQGQMAGIYPNYSEKINPAIQALPKESGLGKILEELRVNNPKGGIQGPLGTPATIGKLGELVSKPGAVSGLVNKGSIPLLLMAMAEAANANQSKLGNAVVPPKTSEGGAAFGGFTSGKKYQAAKLRAEQGDVNTLPDPRTYAAVQGLMGVPPDQLGFSVLHPDYKNIRDVADPAYAASILATLLPGLSKFGKK